MDGELLGGTLDYDGATQLGSPHKTDSKWRDRSAAMILERRLRGPLPIHVGANLRYRWLDRSIQSTASVAGLSENYRTFWLGVRGLVKPTKALSLSVNLAHALDSTVAVAFDSALDNVALDVGGHWRAGIAANLDIRRMGSRTLYLRPFADWQQSPRTASAPLTSGGMPVGTVFLPETEVLRFGLTFGVRGQQQPPES